MNDTVNAEWVRPESLEERVLWHCIVWTYVYYLLGALYVLAPAVGWTLLIVQARRGGLVGIPAAAWSWVGGMLLMLIALIVGHADQDMGLAAMGKSAVGWAKGWGLIAVFVLIGCGRVRLVVLARAANILGLQTLIVLPFVVLAWVAGLPGHLYVSPASIVGGPGPEYFAVELYGISPDNGLPRWRLFAPWAPAIGMVMSAYIFIALNDPSRRWRWLGVPAMVLAILLSASRLGLLAVPAAYALCWVLRNLGSVRTYVVAAPIALLAGGLAETITDAYENAMSTFHGSRADSSRVRAALGRIAIERWYQDGFWWGHGNVERGPHLVEYMPIGSHHTWFGLLFVKGLVGVLALVIPLAWSIVALLGHVRFTQLGRTALSLLMIIVLYTFAENLEILAYLYWPALVTLGIALRAAAVPAQRGSEMPIAAEQPV